MAGDIFQPLTTGTVWRPKARQINSFIAAAREQRNRTNPARDQRPAESRAGAIVLVVNATEGELDVGAAVALGAPICEPDDDPGVVLADPVFTGDEPEATSKHLAILLEPIAEGAVGQAAIPNAAWARVNVIDEAHETAEPAASTLLNSASDGRFPIVWKAAGTGEKWAIISLSAPAAGGDTIVFGQLLDTIPAKSSLDDCIHLQTMVNGVETYLFHDEDEEEPVLVGGINSTWSPIRGSTGLAITVWGKLYTVMVPEDPEDEESPLVAKRRMHIQQFDMAGMSGHVTTTPDGAPQGPSHASGSDAYGVDGGPCDDCVEPEP